MKRTASVILALVMLFTLAACGVQGGKKNPSTSTDITQKDIEKLLEELEKEEKAAQ